MWIILKKTLVYYQGRAPRGTKTDWVMKEYRLPDGGSSSASGPAHSKEDIVLCKVYRKATTMKELEKRAAIEEASTPASRYMTSMKVNVSSESVKGWGTTVDEDLTSSTANIKDEAQTEIQSSSSESVDLLEIEVPMHNNAEWSQDTFLNQLPSPWIDQRSPYANVLHF